MRSRVRSIRAVLLDMGGVLLDPGNAQGLPSGKLDYRGREALLQLLKRHGATPSFELLEQLLFAPWQAEYKRRYETGREADWKPHLTRLRRRLHVRAHDLQLLGAWFAPYGETMTLLPDARETVAAVAASGYALGLVSNVPLPGKLYLRLLARHGLVAPFATLQFSYDTGSRKPSPAMIRGALAALGVEPEHAVMVGDRRGADVAAGRAAGVTTIWLESADGGGPAPDHAIRRLGELPPLLARL